MALDGELGLRDSAGPGTLQLADIIRDEVARAWRSPP
jgi:hypothetical protein